MNIHNIAYFFRFCVRQHSLVVYVSSVRVLHEYLVPLKTRGIPANASWWDFYYLTIPVAFLKLLR